MYKMEKGVDKRDCGNKNQVKGGRPWLRGQATGFKESKKRGT